MKNMKKLTRENLKNVKGAGGPTYPDDSIYYCHCGGTGWYIVEEKSCMDINGNYYPPICQ